MSNTPIPMDISNNKDLLRLAEEVKKTKTPRELKKDDETVAVLMPVGRQRRPLVDEILKQTQEGTRLLSLAGSLAGPEDMSTNKKKYL